MSETHWQDVLATQLAQRRTHGAQLMNTLAHAPGTFTHFLRRAASDRLERPALICGARAQSYGQLLAAIDATRHQLNALGIGAGQPVAMLLGNSDHYVVCYLAVLAHGAVAVPINNRLTGHELGYILGHARCRLLVTEAGFADVIEQAQGQLATPVPTLVLDTTRQPAAAEGQPPLPEPALAPQAPAALYYTSGTTGRPKAVVHTHASLIAITLQSPQAWEYEFDDLRSLALTPLFHIAAHTIFLPVLAVGGTLVIDSYGTDRAFDLLLRHRITAFFAVPAILLLMVERAKATGTVLPEVRTLMFGAAPMTISRLSEVQQLFPNAGLVHGMGQTESGGTLVTLPSVAAYAKAGSVGLPMAGVEIAIVDESDRPVPPGQVGELVARGPNLMRAYLDNPAASAETLRGGWLHTGDMGVVDEAGFVTLVDRKKDMIIRGGENIYSSEVEQALLSHPALLSAAVVGQPDALFGEQVAAFLVPKAGRPPVSDDELRQHCRQRLADYKVPVTFRWLPELPLTATGKVTKAPLRQALAPPSQ